MNQHNFYKYSTYGLAVILAVVAGYVVFSNRGQEVKANFEDLGGTAETQPGEPWYIPESFLTAYSIYRGVDSGVRFADVNGDGLPDLLHGSPGGGAAKLYLNTGSGWAYTGTGGPFGFYNSDTRMADVNGDGLIDILSSKQEGTQHLQQVKINQGTNEWIDDPTWVIPVPFTNGDNDNGVQLVDVNGDGLVDILWSNDRQWVETPVPHNEVYLNNGAGWVAVP